MGLQSFQNDQKLVFDNLNFKIVLYDVGFILRPTKVKEKYQ